MADKQTVELSNFRKEATIENWPSGSKKVTAVFTHETKSKRGQRIIRTTTGAPKASTYYHLVCLADGSDGKTYYVGLSEYGGLSVMHCDMKYHAFTLFGSDLNYNHYKAELVKVATV